MGITIFERTTRRVLVTEEGRRFVEQARKVLAEARHLFIVAQRSDGPFGGPLHLSAIATLGPYFFPRVLRKLRDDYPTLALILGEGLTGELVPKLIAGEIDAVLLTLPHADPALSTAPIFSEPFLLACPRGHPASQGGGLTWDDLPANERLLLEEGHCLREQALAACSSVDHSSRHGTSLETLKYMVAAGEGCTFVPALAVTDSDAVVYSPLPLPDYSRTIGLAWRRSDPRSAAFAALAENLRTFARSLGLPLGAP